MSSEDLELKAYMLIDADIGRESECLRKIESMGCDNYRMKCHMVYGTYDIVVEIYSRSVKDIKSAADGIRGMEIVNSALAMLLV